MQCLLYLQQKICNKTSTALNILLCPNRFSAVFVITSYPAIDTKHDSTVNIFRYLRFDRGAINFTPPGFSSIVVAATIWSSFSRFSDTGDVGTAAVASFVGLARLKLPVAGVLLGLIAAGAGFELLSCFFSVFLDGGGGMSSSRP